MDELDRVKRYIKYRRRELVVMGMNQRLKNMKRGLAMQEDPFAGQLGIANRELKRIQKIVGLTDEEVFAIE